MIFPWEKHLFLRLMEPRLLRRLWNGLRVVSFNNDVELKDSASTGRLNRLLNVNKNKLFTDLLFTSSLFLWKPELKRKNLIMLYFLNYNLYVSH